MSERADVVSGSVVDSGGESGTDESLRICLITKMYPPRTGGGATYAYEVANALGEFGHEVDVYTQAVSGEDESVETHPNVDVTRITKARPLVVLSTLYFSIACRPRIDLEEYDVIHGTLMPASTIAFGPWLVRGLDAPLVLTSHGKSLGEVRSVALETPSDYLFNFVFHPLNVVMDYAAGRHADRVIAISEHSERQLTEVYGIGSERVEMIPHGVDTKRFYPRDQQHPEVSDDKTTLLFVGRLGARKGLNLALRSLAQINNDDLEFLIVGTGRHEEHLSELVDQLGILQQVRFLGYVSDSQLPELYSSADMFVLPSKYEGFGLVALEAMACGTPVIGVAAGGIPTAVGNGEGGIVVDRSRTELAKAIEKASSNTWQEKARLAALERVQSMTWTHVGQAVDKLYDECLQNTRPTRK